MRTWLLSMNICAAAVCYAPFASTAEEPLSLEQLKQDPLGSIKKLNQRKKNTSEGIQQVLGLLEGVHGELDTTLPGLQASADQYVEFQHLHEYLYGLIHASEHISTEEKQKWQKQFDEIQRRQFDFEARFSGKLPLHTSPILGDRRHRVPGISSTSASRQEADPFLDLRCDIPGKTYEDWYAGMPDANVQRFLIDLLAQRLQGSSSLNNLLLYGPKGTGKTTLAHAIAAASGYPTFKISTQTVQRAEIGASAQLLAALFDQAYAYALKHDTRVILFTDEVDAIFTIEGAKGGSAAHNQQVASIFQNYFSQSGGKYADFLDRVMYIATTNFRESIPEPILSRFVHQAEIKDISVEQRELVIRHMIRKKGHVDIWKLTDADYKEVAEWSETYGLDLRQIEAAIGQAFSTAQCVRMKEETAAKPALQALFSLIQLPKNTVGIVTMKILLRELKNSQVTQGTKPESDEWRNKYI